MNRLSPRLRKMTLAGTIFLALVVFPALSLLESIHSGRGASVQTWRARRMAKAVQEQARAQELTAAHTSTEVFNGLVKSGILQENLFFVPGQIPKKRQANGDGVLQSEENCVALVAGLPADAPDNLPILLWDPDPDAPVGLRSLERPWRWLSVDGKGRVSLQAGPPAWWKERTAEDLLPGVPGVQRLLRP